MKIVVLGNSKFTISCFEALKKKTKNQLVLVSQKKNFQPKNSINMKAYAKKNNINFEIIEPKKRKITKKSYADNFIK